MYVVGRNAADTGSDIVASRSRRRNASERVLGRETGDLGHVCPFLL